MEFEAGEGVVCEDLVLGGRAAVHVQVVPHSVGFGTAVFDAVVLYLHVPVLHGGLGVKGG